MTAIADRYRTLADAFERKIVAVAPDEWSNQSPCEEWTARGVVGHIVDVHGMMLKPLDRDLSPAPSVDDDPMAAFRSARADIEAVLDDPDRAGAEYDGAFGRTKVESTIDTFLGFDLVVHGWDLARATGQDDTSTPRSWSGSRRSRRRPATTCGGRGCAARRSTCPLTRRSKTGCSARSAATRQATATRDHVRSVAPGVWPVRALGGPGVRVPLSSPRR